MTDGRKKIGQIVRRGTLALVRVEFSRFASAKHITKGDWNGCPEDDGKIHCNTEEFVGQLFFLNTGKIEYGQNIEYEELVNSDPYTVDVWSMDAASRKEIEEAGELDLLRSAGLAKMLAGIKEEDFPDTLTLAFDSWVYRSYDMYDGGFDFIGIINQKSFESLEIEAPK